MRVTGGSPRNVAGPPDLASPLRPEPAPTRPALRDGDPLSLTRMVIRFAFSWEIYYDARQDIWIAQGVTLSNRWARFEADTAEHLAGLIEGA
jgi:hypothetical protein